MVVFANRGRSQYTDCLRFYSCHKVSIGWIIDVWEINGMKTSGLVIPIMEEKSMFLSWKLEQDHYRCLQHWKSHSPQGLDQFRKRPLRWEQLQEVALDWLILARRKHHKQQRTLLHYRSPSTASLTVSLIMRYIFTSSFAFAIFLPDLGIINIGWLETYVSMKGLLFNKKSSIISNRLQIQDQLQAFAMSPRRRPHRSTIKQKRRLRWLCHLNFRQRKC